MFSQTFRTGLWKFGFLSVFIPHAIIGAAEPQSSAKVDFNRDIRPILSSRCLNCHGIDEESRKGELRLDQRADTVRDRNGYKVIAPKSPDESELIARITSGEADEVMPPPKSGPPLKKEEVALFRKWIAQGADYSEHWAFQPVVKQKVPETSNHSWARNPVDSFILSRLDQIGLKPAAPADKATLIRRLSLDLTGLPPQPDEVDRYLADHSANATEKLVKRLLDSPHYGERLARVWLDVARYADSKGYGSDPLREYMWRYRDWVIDSFNQNKPYDQFVTEQLAGDLLPNATNDQMLATSFHRNTMTNDEGGTDDEEFRVAAVKDRVDTTGQVFMGLTVGCAKCHTHKFDPISQREYYQLFAIFNQTEDNDNPNDEPRLPTPTKNQAQQIAKLEFKIKELMNLPVPKSDQFKQAFEGWTASIKNNTDWQPARIESISSATKLRRLEKGKSINEVIGSGDADKATDEVVINVPQGVTAIRLETVADETEIKGPGLASHGNFVLSSISGTVDDGKAGIEDVRYVRVELPGPEKMISLAEVEVFRGAENVALKGEAKQSSTDFNGPAHLAIDGNTNGNFESGKSVTHTAVSKDPWWEVDLKDRAGRVDKVQVWNRTDNNLQARLAGASVLFLNKDRKVLRSIAIKKAPDKNEEIVLGGPRAVTFASATSSYDQTGFEVSKAINPGGKNEGWGVGGMTGLTQDAVFRVSGPMPAGKLNLKLVQNWGQRHLLGRYNIFFSSEPEPPSALPTEIRDLAESCDCCRKPEDQVKIEEYYWRNIAPETRAMKQERAKLETELAKIRSQVIRTPILKDLPTEKKRKTHILVKGNYTQFGDAVTAGLMGSFHKYQSKPGQELTRLDLAKWITDKKNPLTARVAVNRMWAMIFGRGLVETEEDFGTQGRVPSHPELLDYLASEFMNHEWDTKWLVETIVNTSTYQQSSVPADREKLASIDPRNELLSHYPRTRLEAETIRDQALVVSGLFSPKIGGASVYPPQPDNLWQAAFNGQRTYPTSKGEDKYRRGLYTFWRRTVPNPSMTTFDAPSREVCSIRRIGSNTPLQAYVTLNDPVFVEAAQALGRRMMKEGGKTLTDQLRYGYKLATAREIEPKRLEILTRLFKDELNRFEKDKAAAKEMAENQIGPLPEGMRPEDAAAMSVIGNVLLNLDAVLTKG